MRLLPIRHSHITNGKPPKAVNLHAFISDTALERSPNPAASPLTKRTKQDPAVLKYFFTQSKVDRSIFTKAKNSEGKAGSKPSLSPFQHSTVSLARQRCMPHNKMIERTGQQELQLSGVPVPWTATRRAYASSTTSVAPSPQMAPNARANPAMDHCRPALLPGAETVVRNQ